MFLDIRTAPPPLPDRREPYIGADTCIRLPPPEAEQPPPGGRGNYLLRHWRGELSLPVSYWLNGSLLAGVGTAALGAAIAGLRNLGYSLRFLAAAGVMVLLFSVLAWLWSVVGIWRSAGRHGARGGSRFWGALARIMVVLGVVAMAGNLARTTLPQLREYGLIAMGRDPLGEVDIRLAPDGRSVLVRGTLREGAAAAVLEVVDAHPGVASLVLNSNGGRTLEGERLAKAVRARKLDTYVAGRCESACTFIFLAGRERVATANARIGFHQPDFVGSDAEGRRQGIDEMLAIYRAAGLPEAFIQRALDTPPDQMWYPSRKELLVNRVVTRIALGGEVASGELSAGSREQFVQAIQGSPLYQAYEKRFPGTVGQLVDKAWAARQKGGDDAEIAAAMGKVTAPLLPRLLRSADDAVLERFLTVLETQMAAARAVSVEACARLAAGTLDVARTLPPAVLEEEQQFFLEALAAPPRQDGRKADEQEGKGAIQAALVKLPPRYRAVVNNRQALGEHKEAACDGTLAFYRSIRALPARQRQAALRWLFQRPG